MSGDITTLLGPGAFFEGKLAFRGIARIEGEFRGTIASDDTLIIAEGGSVHAEIDVGTLIVRGGELVGNVRARDAIEVHAPARVTGDLHSPSLFLDRGVAFEGRCRMDALDAKSSEDDTHNVLDRLLEPAPEPQTIEDAQLAQATAAAVDVTLMREPSVE